MQTLIPTREKTRDLARSRGSLGRRLILAMLLVIVGGLAIGMPQGGGAETLPTLRGSVPLRRHEAVAGALRLERPASPIPSRVGGTLRLSSERVSPAALQ